MEELKKSLLELWNGLTGPRKLSLVGSFVGILAVLIAIVYFASQPKHSLLFAGVSPTEASKIVEFLQSKQIPYELGDGGSTILIPASQVYETRLSLAAQGIPRTSDSAGGVGFELFDKPTFGVSDFMQRANYYRALQGELARTIKQIDEVKEARVMIVVPEERLFSRERRESKASVFVQIKPGRVLSPQNVQAIRFLVANGVEGLQPTRVAIIDNSGRALAEDEQLSSLGTLSNRQQGAVKETEDHLREKAQSMLDQVLGPGNSVIRITAELNFDTIQETSESFDSKAPVVRSETINSESNNSNTTSLQGAAGTPGNSQPGAAAQPGPTTNSTIKRENTTNQYEIGRTVQSRQQAVGQVKKLGVAVFINMRKTSAADGKTTSQPRTDQEKKALEEIVKASIGFTVGTERKDTLQLVETEFTDLFATAQPEGSMPVLAKVDKWLPWVTQGFLVLMAGAVLLYLRSILKSTSEDEHDSASEFADLLARFEPTEDEDEDKKKKEVEKPGFLTPQEMVKVLRDNPANTTLAIKQWMAGTSRS